MKNESPNETKSKFWIAINNFISANVNQLNLQSNKVV